MSAFWRADSILDAALLVRFYGALVMGAFESWLALRCYADYQLVKRHIATHEYGDGDTRDLLDLAVLSRDTEWLRVIGQGTALVAAFILILLPGPGGQLDWRTAAGVLVLVLQVSQVTVGLLTYRTRHRVMRRAEVVTP